ncbi:hypothetical protein OH76DRAFT_1419473 [Lentinus brumalis]|uniref:DUF6532 domain-containing protein n=1 Tax=Lentinus brumalis TaxID=2498619 RepID=A0A371D554_9APHY|nr:hypothetical protein OH76DRAFT_1419473 [Polyporus brumalis]
MSVPDVPLPGRTPKRRRRFSTTRSQSHCLVSSGDEEDAEKTERSDLEELEKNPRALEAQFEAEAVNWVDDDDGHEVPTRSPSPTPRPRKKRAKDVATSEPDEPEEHHTSKKLKSSITNSEKSKCTHDDVKCRNGTKSMHATQDPPSSRDKARRTQQSSHQHDKEDARRATVGSAKSKRGTSAVNSYREGQLPKAAGLKRKVREDIEWAHPSEDERELPLKPKRSRKGRKSKRADSGNDDDSSSSDSGSDPDVASDSDDSDDDGIDLVLRKRGGRLKLKNQRPRVGRVAKQAIDDMLLSVCIINAYPDGPDKSNDFAQSSLRRSAKALGDMDIARRLKHDDKYCKKLATIPLQRIPNFRGKVKKVTDTLVRRTYGLQQGDALKVIWFQEGLRYIFPFDYEKKTIVDTEPYSTSIFVEALRDCFFARPRSYGYRIASHFGSSLPEASHEKEIPAAMLALLATVIYASIDDYRNVRFEAGDFKSNLFIDVYRQNIATLSDIKKQVPHKYHRFMHGLFKEVCTASGPNTQVKSFLNTKGMVDE